MCVFINLLCLSLLTDPRCLVGESWIMLAGEKRLLYETIERTSSRFGFGHVVYHSFSVKLSDSITMSFILRGLIRRKYMITKRTSF